MAKNVEKVRPERISVLSNEDEVGTYANEAANAAPELEGEGSFQALGQTEAASADASEQPSTEPVGLMEAADADVSTAAQAANISFSASSDVVEAVSADADAGLVPQNGIVSTKGLKRVSNAPLNAVRRPVAVMVGAKSIPRPSADGLTPREVERLKSFDDFWLRDKETDAGASTPQEKEPETPATVEEIPEEVEETPSVPENEVDAETHTQQEKVTPSATAEENPEAQVEERTGGTSEEAVSPLDVEQTDVETEEAEEKPSTSQDDTEESALETPEETAPSSEQEENVVTQEVQPPNQDSVDTTIEIGEEEETPTDISPVEADQEVTVSLGATGIGGDEAALEATIGFTQDKFEVSATSSSPLSEEGLTAVDLESSFSISENTSVRVAANDVTSETETTFDVGLETQVLPDLSVGTSFEDLDDVKVNVETAWQASETVEIAFGVDDITAEKVVNIEANYTDPGELFAITARANDALRPATRTFDLDATYKVNRWVSTSLSIEAIPAPAVGVGTEFQLNRNTGLVLEVEDIFGEQTYGAELQFKF